LALIAALTGLEHETEEYIAHTPENATQAQ
jgi:hypothetical protein